jgi:hypothetical protein
MAIAKNEKRKKAPRKKISTRAIAWAYQYNRGQ